MKRILIALVLVSSLMLVVAPVTAAPRWPDKWDIIAPVPNSTVDYYESSTGLPNPYAEAPGPGEVGVEWYPPPPGQTYFSSRVSLPYLYSQGDPSWSGDVMQTRGLTIGSAGCALTSVSMVFRGYGASKNPHDFNIAMGGSACWFVWADAPPKAGEGEVALTANSPYIRLGWNYDDSLPFADWYNMAWALQRGFNPVIEVTRPNGTCHWVVVVQVIGPPNAASSYRIVDPNGGYERPLTDYTSGQSCHVTSIVIYERQ